MYRSCANLLIIVVLLLFQNISISENSREDISLNGTWQFKLAEPDDQSDFSDIKVPGNWSIQGFCRPHWAWSSNQMGIYKRNIKIPAGWADKKIFINFGGIYYRAKIFLDDKLIGHHESGYTQFEYNITDSVKPGNTYQLKVEVYTYGKYLDFDNLDFWALPGIYRDVKLIARPAQHITNWKYKTKWTEAKADVTFQGQLNNGSDATLCIDLKFQGKKVLNKKIPVINGKFTGTISVDNPQPWTAETPNLYDITLILEQNEKNIDQLAQKIGLREIEVLGPDIIINGKEIRINGVARHDLWPDRGRAIGKDISEKDIIMMKQAGINAVRTAHHTCEKSFIELADKYGLYIFNNIAMSNVRKTHLNDPNYVEGALVRTRETVKRDILNPSVIVWTMGNENYMGYLHKPMYDEIKKLDGSRVALMPWYFGDANFPELNSVHYPKPYRLLTVLADFPDRPLVCTEYQHCGFDGMGSLDETWDIFDISPAGSGGTIWEWFDQGVENHWMRSWESYWPDVVTITPQDDPSKTPSGFGPCDSRTPVTINIEHTTDAGDYKLNLYIMKSSKPDRVEVCCDGVFLGIYRTENRPLCISYPLKLQYSGQHIITLKWDFRGEGHDFDCIQLTDAQNETVWQIGKKDDSANEFAAKFGEEKMKKTWLDSVSNQGADGMLSPYREFQDEYYNMKANYAPVKIEERDFDLLNNKWIIEVENRYSFTDLDHKTKFLLQYFDGKNIKEKTIKAPQIKLKADNKKIIELDLSCIDKNKKNLTAISWQIPASDKFQPQTLGQIWHNLSKLPPETKKAQTEIKAEFNNDKLTVKAANAKIIFDKKTGSLVEYQVNKKQLIKDAINIGIWKPTLVYEQNFIYPNIDISWEWEKRGFVERQPEGEIVRVPEHMQYKHKGNKFIVTFINQYLLSGTDKKIMRGFESYEIDRTGTFTLKGCWHWQSSDSQLRRIGFDLFIPEYLDMMTWSGRGPYACYSDAIKGFNDCIHQLNRDDRNCITNKTDTKWLRWSDANTSLTLIPDYNADIEATVLPGITLQRISDTRGCGNKYCPPTPQHWIYKFQNEVIQMAITVQGR